MKKNKWSIRIVFPLIMSIVIAFCIITCALISFHGLSKYFLGEAVKEIGRQKGTLSQEIENEIENLNDLVNRIYYQSIRTYDFQDDRFSEALETFIDEQRQLIYGVALYDLQGNCIWNSEKVSKASVKEELWFARTKRNIETVVVGKQKMVYGETLKNIYPVSRYVEYLDKGEMCSGVVCVQYYTDSIESIIEDYGNNKTEYCYLTDENGQLIYHPFVRMIQSELYEEKTLECVLEGKEYVLKTYDEVQWIIETQQIGHTGWNVVVVNSLVNLQSENLNIYYMIWMIFLLVGITLIFFDILLFRNFTDPVYKLMHTMNEFGKGNYSEKAEEAGIGELKSLSHHFNRMAEQIQMQMEEIRNNEREKQKMEKKLLQSQINPHFLYNTLDSIIWMIQCGEYSGAEKMVSLLAKFFRVSLSQGKDMIPLEKELEHATSYLAIQNIRFKDKFEFCVNAEVSLMKYLCPKLSIQPLLENAIYHGMEAMYEDGEIHINVYEKENVIHIDVVDNGLGMTEEKINYIMNHQVVSSRRGSGIGVRNVDERIKLIYGAQYGVTIKSELDEGTVVTITIPKLEEADEKW